MRAAVYKGPRSIEVTDRPDPVTIWVVRYDDSLYVRSVNGRPSTWFRETQVRHEGRIRAGSAMITTLRPQAVT
jgi:hypothetical protein